MIEESRNGGPTGSITASVGRSGSAWFVVLSVGALLAVYHVLLRPWHRTWGATDEEVNRQLPGDEVVPEPSDETTRAVTVEASSDDVWLWVVQLGQRRGGFYSYTWLENLFGAGIHNVDRIVPEFQELEEGDSIRMVREDYWLQSSMTSMTVRRPNVPEPVRKLPAVPTERSLFLSSTVTSGWICPLCTPN